MRIALVVISNCHRLGRGQIGELTPQLGANNDKNIGDLS